MKTMKITSLIVLAIVFLNPSNLFSQDEAQKENSVEESSFSIGADLVNRYIFRGLDFGSSPAIQPSIEYSIGDFAIGAWGSYSFLSTPVGIEADLYASYGLDFGLSLGVTDYYFPGEKLMIGADSVISPIRTGKYFDYSKSHFFELNASQSIGDFYLAANWGFSNMNNALYFEAGYGFKYFDVFVGAGNEVYTTDGNFNVVNVGISASKELKITENYSLPISASVILNPDTEQFHLVFAVSL